MPASIPHFIALEMLRVNMLCRIRLLTLRRHRPLVAVLWMEMIIHMTVETGLAMKPRTSANKDASAKPLRPIVAIRSAIVRSNVVITVRTIRRHTNLDAHLRSLCFGVRSGQADSRSSS